MIIWGLLCLCSLFVSTVLFLVIQGFLLTTVQAPWPIWACFGGYILSSTVSFLALVVNTITAKKEK